MTIPNRDVPISISVSNLAVKVRNIDSISEAISNLKSATSQDISQLEEQLKKTYISDATLCLCKRGMEEDDTAILINSIADIIKNSDTDKAEELAEQFENKPADFLKSAGITDDTTDEELEQIADEAAKELADAIESGDSETDNELANAILDQLNEDSGNNNSGSDPSGLRGAYYKTMKSMRGMHDVKSVLYSTGLATDTATYFSTGVLLITIHLGGSCIVGAGTSLLMMTAQNILSEMKTIQSGAENTNFPNQLYQAQGLRDGFSNLITNGTITGLNIGTMTSGDSIVPYVIGYTQNQINHSPTKILIYVAAIAAFAIMLAGALASQKTGKQESFNKLIGIPNAFKDGDDLFAALLAAAVKASILLTVTKTTDSGPPGSTGTGLLLPIGP